MANRLFPEHSNGAVPQFAARAPLRPFALVCLSSGVVQSAPATSVIPAAFLYTSSHVLARVNGMKDLTHRLSEPHVQRIAFEARMPEH